MELKTNPMRHLDKLGIAYSTHYYGEEALSGIDVANTMGEDPEVVFKTLVTESKDRKYYVFMVPVTGELDLKKAAASVGEKSLSMIPSKNLLGLTGYVHGGCSPLCLKRPMRVTIDSTCQAHERVYFSAGKIGYQIEMAVADLGKAMDFQFADIRKPGSERCRVLRSLFILNKRIPRLCRMSCLSTRTATAPRPSAPGTGTATTAWSSTRPRARRSPSASGSWSDSESDNVGPVIWALQTPIIPTILGMRRESPHPAVSAIVSWFSIIIVSIRAGDAVSSARGNSGRIG